MKRRTFVKSVFAGSAIASSPGIFFPKPADTSNLNYSLNVDGTSTAVFNTFVATNIARNVSDKLPPATEPVVVETVAETQSRLEERGYTTNQTPFSQRLGQRFNPLWGKQRNEELGPNPGFGTLQIYRNELQSITFSGSTTLGIDAAIQKLKADGYSANEIDDALLPISKRFEDWGSWYGDIDLQTGELKSTVSLASYETRYGSVRRRYEIIEPGPDGFGRIRLEIRGGQRIAEDIFIDVLFGQSEASS